MYIFSSSIEHVARVCRILTHPQGHALLLTGIGEEAQTIAKLATFIQEYQFFELVVTRSYRKEDWKNDLRKGNIKSVQDPINIFLVITRTTSMATPTVFLCTESAMNITSSEIPFLEDLCSLMQNGMVPGLFKGDDRKLITQSIDSVSIKDGERVYDDHIFEKLTQTVRENLHIVLCLKNSPETLRGHIREFPALVTCATPDWFAPWKEDELKAVAEKHLNGVEAWKPEIKQSILRCIRDFVISSKSPI
jgi:dynein heavy chain